ncbi:MULTISPECIES: glycosyltransferase family 2 protein [unclassified Solwaraspora]|uniref:glycosyltransferase family 2 protein n=1 Tax=unclassified Solwaraspora TaxID=2627926 RepID=UPI00248AF600|nr:MULTISPECIES: glycosyltransferase family 2 protein [unclassified Solwaraspora]WBB99485.1 glycosyltransferase family 2 protein [Solwaraspora sp. WMMA2059]WBC21965.1 glycosyltransferase family 2 protein [Solwaraspora sp. WMMA2080]WJK35988.1 glycosyltransferase family 2 protein [Solwaraspora sp. WMMA2065]
MSENSSEFRTPSGLPRVSAVVLAWGAEPLLRRSVEALLASVKVDVDVVLVDNGCTTDDVTVLREVPGVTVVGDGRNVGFSAGCNVGVAAAVGEYVALVNGDAVVEPTTVARLVEELADPSVGIAAGAVRLADEPDLLNSRGNEVHVLGLSWIGGFRERETRTEPTETAGAMGACLMTRRAHWDRLGGFDPHYFAYHEDADLSIRTWRVGLRVVNVPDAVALHRYEFSRNSFKFYLVERNRVMFVATVWGGRSLVLLGPPLLALELAVLVLAARQGWLPDKLRGYRWLWQHRSHLRQRRAQLQAERTVPDRVWMRVLADRLDTPLIDPPGRKVLNAMLAAYWRTVRHWV